MEKPTSEAEKFFNSLPSETQEKEFNFFEQPEKQPEKEVVEPEKEETQEEPKEDEANSKHLNRKERRAEANRFYEDQLKRERERAERLETELLKRTQPETKTDTDARFTRLFGDTPEGKEASRIVQELLKETEERAVAPYKEIVSERQAKSEAEKRIAQAIEHGIESVEDSFGVDLTSANSSKSRSEFIDFVKELSPEDSLVNFEKAWPLFQSSMKVRSTPEEIDRKKQIASRSIQRSSPQRPDPSKLEPVSFEKVEGIFSKMFKH